MSVDFDVAVIGGGIVGLASAYQLTRHFSLSLIVLETEKQIAQHQTGHNSGVIHSGLYYRPGSLKAENCTVGREALYRFCREHDIPHDQCGKIVVACDEDEIPALQELHCRGEANGLRDLKWLSASDLRDYEPHVAGVAGLHVPQTGIVDYPAMAAKLADLIRNQSGVIRTESQFIDLKRSENALNLNCSGGNVRSRFLINCAGLYSDRVARTCGVEPNVQIIPFRGEYYELTPERTGLVRNLIYPVPDPRFPFLGVHFTRMIHGGIEAGPNAVLALQREGYSWGDVSIHDLAEMATYSGFWNLARKYGKTGIGEAVRSLSKRAFLKALQRLIPELQLGDITFAGSGVRAQAVDPKGKLIDDFRIEQAERMIHVLNAPSPAATASLSIGQKIADLAGDQFQLPKR